MSIFAILSLYILYIVSLHTISLSSMYSLCILSHWSPDPPGTSLKQPRRPVRTQTQTAISPHPECTTKCTPPCTQYHVYGCVRMWFFLACLCLLHPDPWPVLTSSLVQASGDYRSMNKTFPLQQKHSKHFRQTSADDKAKTARNRRLRVRWRQSTTGLILSWCSLAPHYPRPRLLPWQRSGAHWC